MLLRFRVVSKAIRMVLLLLLTDQCVHARMSWVSRVVTVATALVAGIVKIAKESGETNIVDILTKLIPGMCLRKLASYVLW
jgi:hypothetical protein